MLAHLVTAAVDDAVGEDATRVPRDVLRRQLEGPVVIATIEALVALANDVDVVVQRLVPPGSPNARLYLGIRPRARRQRIRAARCIGR